MVKLRKALVAATLIALPLVTPVLDAAPAAAAELVSAPAPDTSGYFDETAGWKEFKGQYQLCRSMGDPRWVCFLYALG